MSILPDRTQQNQLKKTIFITVINDLSTEHRMHKTALTLLDEGFMPVLIGTEKSDSGEVSTRPYPTHRFKMMFKKGTLFYAEYNIRLIFYMLFQNPDLLLSVDLDSALAGFVYHKMTKTPQVLDNHEYLPEVPELVDRPNIKRKWEQLQDEIYPKIPVMYTVCDSIANMFRERYHKQVEVVRNVPHLERPKSESSINANFPTDKAIILYQGSINMGRGLEEAIQAMHHIENAYLLIVGTGDIIENLYQLIRKEKLSEKVFLTGGLPFDQLQHITPMASIGLSIEKDLGLNYRFALPNKLFDYIHSEVPVLVSNLPEMAKLVKSHKVGDVLDIHSPEAIAAKLNRMLNNKEQLESWKSNCKVAKQELCWEKEDMIIRKIFERYK